MQQQQRLIGKVNFITSVPTDVAQGFIDIAHQRGLSRSRLLRELILKEVEAAGLMPKRGKAGR